MITKQEIKEKFQRVLTRISPKWNTMYVYKNRFGKKIDLVNPKTLDEKIQWLKFNTYYNNSLVRECVDKYLVRNYLKKMHCDEIAVEAYGFYDTIDEIPWDSLPNKFVLKWNFGCGQNLICFDKSKLDIEDAKKKLKSWYKEKDTFYLTHSEMQYRGIKPKLVCERLIEGEDGGLPIDYKLYCFNGHAHCVLVCVGRGADGQGAKYYFFDRNWNLLRYNKAGKDAPEGFTVPKPEGVDKLFEYADKLSAPFPFVRADFYVEKGKVIFGELTFTPCGGFDTGRLPETQLLFGSMVKL